MNKCYKEQAKQRLNLHKLSGINSNLSVFEAAKLFDVLAGKTNKLNGVVMSLIHDINLN